MPKSHSPVRNRSSPISAVTPTGLLSPITGSRPIGDHRVTFSYKDRSDENRTRTMDLPAIEFIRRFLLHVLPYRFMKIRNFGFLANDCKAKAILLIRRLIGKAVAILSFAKETVREKMLRLSGNDVLRCPHYQQGTMRFLTLLHADSS